MSPATVTTTEGQKFVPTGEFRAPRKGERYVSSLQTVSDALGGSRARVSEGNGTHGESSPRIILKPVTGFAGVSKWGTGILFEAKAPGEAYLRFGGSNDAIMDAKTVRGLRDAMTAWLSTQP